MYLLLIIGVLAVTLIFLALNYKDLGRKMDESTVDIFIFIIAILMPVLLGTFFLNIHTHKMKEKFSSLQKLQNHTDTLLNQMADKLDLLSEKIEGFDTKENSFSDSSTKLMIDSFHHTMREARLDLQFMGEKYMQRTDSLEIIHKKHWDSLLLTNNETVLQAIDQLKLTKPKNYNLGFLMGSVLMVPTVIFLLAWIFTKNTTWIKAAITTGILSISSKIAFEGKLAFSPKFVIELPQTDSSAVKTGIDTLTIGPFKSGYAELEPLGWEKLENSKNIFTDPKKHYQEISIYGGVDKRPLRRKALLKFGDNLSLAQARANFIQNYLHTNIFALQSASGLPYFIVSVNGAHTYDDQDSLAFTYNRSVKIVSKYTLQK